VSASAIVPPPMSSPRRVLVLAYFFPPLGGAGVQRSLKFVKYLPEHGFAPTVITTSSRRYQVHDDSLTAEIPPGTRVVRAVDIPLPTWFAGVLRRLGLRRAAAVASWPDISLGWAVAAAWKGWREIRRERPDVILTSSAPYSAHLAGWALHRMTGVPWVADFRDEWAANPHAGEQPRLSRTLTRRAEAVIAREAERVIVVADYFDIAGAPSGSPKRVEIPNGVDADDLARAAPSPTPGPAVFRLSFIGSIYAEQDCAPVLEAVGRLIDRGTIDPSRLELRVVGRVWLPDFERRSPVRLVATGYVDHDRALAEMADATALLFYVAPSSLAPSGKLYEYLAAERPILCVARPDNLASCLVSSWHAGRCADPQDPAAIEAAIADLYGRWEAGTLERVEGARARVLERFSRRALTGRLAVTLEEAAGAGADR
jgi:glycosyltransferase involved in cell wall biosynthesis